MLVVWQIRNNFFPLFKEPCGRCGGKRIEPNSRPIKCNHCSGSGTFVRILFVRILFRLSFKARLEHLESSLISKFLLQRLMTFPSLILSFPGVETISRGPFVLRQTCRHCHGTRTMSKDPCRTCRGKGISTVNFFIVKEKNAEHYFKYS